jgi:hypothetical protein
VTVSTSTTAACRWSQLPSSLRRATPDPLTSPTKLPVAPANRPVPPSIVVVFGTAMKRQLAVSGSGGCIADPGSGKGRGLSVARVRGFGAGSAGGVLSSGSNTASSLSPASSRTN